MIRRLVFSPLILTLQAARKKYCTAGFGRAEIMILRKDSPMIEVYRGYGFCCSTWQSRMINGIKPVLQFIKREEVDLSCRRPSLAEVGYMLGRELGNRGFANFLRRLPETKYRVLALEMQDFLRTAEILEQYADSRVDFVDASIAAVAERLKITRILTLDQRDFHVIRPKHSDYFEILPSPDQLRKRLPSCLDSKTVPAFRRRVRRRSCFVFMLALMLTTSVAAQDSANAAADLRVRSQSAADRRGSERQTLNPQMLPSLTGVNGQAANASVNIRSGPGTHYPPIGSLAQDGWIDIVGWNGWEEGRICSSEFKHDLDMWVQVQVGERRGWVARCVLDIRGNITDLPIVMRPASASCSARSTAA